MLKFSEQASDELQDEPASQSQTFKSWKFDELLALDKDVLSKKAFTMVCTNENIEIGVNKLKLHI